MGGSRSALIGATVALAGCASAPARPGLISHPVLVTLRDGSDAAELIADCDRLLATIPVVRSYACGPVYDAGRGTVDLSFDVGIYVAFGSEQDYEAYVEHPNHVELVEKWRPRAESLRVHDFIDAE